MNVEAYALAFRNVYIWPHLQGGKQQYRPPRGGILMYPRSRFPISDDMDLPSLHQGDHLPSGHRRRDGLFSQFIEKGLDS